MESELAILRKDLEGRATFLVHPEPETNGNLRLPEPTIGPETGIVAHGAANYNINYYGVTADTPQDYGKMYYMDFGSAEANYWTEAQLLQVAYGFRPDVPMPQIYYATQADQWAALLHYAKTRLGKVLRIYGVLTTGAGTNTPQIAYADMLDAVYSVTNQGAIPWLSTGFL